MKNIIFVVGLVFLFNSCGKPGVTPQTMEDVIVGKKWWNTSDEEGMLLDEDGSFYLLKVCEPESFMGKWILEEDLIKLRFYVNSIEYTMLVAEVTSYTETELKVKAETTDTNIIANYIFTTDFEEVYGCTDNSANNYNADAMCDDGSCSYCSPAECTYVPDDTFEWHLINLGYDDEMDDYVKTSRIQNIRTLYLEYIDDFDSYGINGIISDLTGIEDFIQLESFYAPFTGSVSFENNQNLESLSLYYGYIDTLDISSNVNLLHLTLEASNVSEISLTNNINLESLILSSVSGFEFLDVSNQLNLNSFIYLQILFVK